MPATATTPGKTLDWDAPLHCCYIEQESMEGCPKDADYEIQDMADSNPYTPVTHACEDHVGAMLGHSADGSFPNGEEDRWEVRAL